MIFSASARAAGAVTAAASSAINSSNAVLRSRETETCNAFNDMRSICACLGLLIGHVAMVWKVRVVQATPGRQQPVRRTIADRGAIRGVGRRPLCREPLPGE